MFRKVMQMIQDYAEKKLLDEVFATYLDVQDAAAEMAQVLPCPRCGKLTMKMRLHSNALSRRVPGIMICDQCGTEEALDAMAGKPKDAHEWALVKTYMKGQTSNEAQGKEAERDGLGTRRTAGHAGRGRSRRADGNMAVAERLPLAWLLGNRRRMAACHYCNHHGGAADARIPDVHDFRRKEAW